MPAFYRDCRNERVVEPTHTGGFPGRMRRHHHHNRGIVMSRVRSRAVESWSRRAETCTCSPNSFSIIVATFGSLRTVARPTRHPQIGGVEETLRQLEPNASVKEVKAYVDALDAVICARVAICALEGRDKPFGDQGLGDLDSEPLGRPQAMIGFTPNPGETCVLIITNSALSGARRSDVTDFGMPEHHGSAAISTSINE